MIHKYAGNFSIQDKGRLKYTKLGVPRASSIDKKLVQKLNAIIGNNKNEAVLEWAIHGPKLTFPKPTYIVISHNNGKTTLNGKSIKAKEKVFVPANSLLKLGAHADYVYQYLIIKGGFQSESILNSQSTLQEYHNFENIVLRYTPVKRTQFEIERPTLQSTQIKRNDLVRVINAEPGPEYHLLGIQQLSRLSGYFSLSSTRNRMGIQFNELMENNLESILSAPIVPGTIQLTSGGKLILLGNDCQTTGGYPRILWLNRKSLVKLYQLHSGIKFRFEINNPEL